LKGFKALTLEIIEETWGPNMDCRGCLICKSTHKEMENKTIQQNEVKEKLKWIKEKKNKEHATLGMILQG